jgi:four helix bundle protein
LSMGPTVNLEAMKGRTKQFALCVIRLCRTLPQSPEARIISRQLLRSATSVGANYRAVCRARSTADFTSKLGLVLEETDETLFWLELLVDAGVARREQINVLLDEANQLVSIFVASLRTVKGLKSEI